MSKLRAIFEAEGEGLRQSVDYRLEGFYLDIVDNIVAAMNRTEPALTKTDLARLMNVSPARVTNLLRGYKPNLELRTIVQVAMALQMEPNELCAHRKTPEMLMRPLRAVPTGFVSASIAEEKKNGKEQAAYG